MSPDVRKVIRAIIYCRVSDPRQEEGHSFDFQEKDGRRWCSEHGYQVIDVLFEIHTGAELDERKVLSDLRFRIYRREFDVLIVWKYDRLSREQTHQAVVLYEAQKYGVRVESTTEVFDDTPLGKFMRQAQAFVAEMERENIKHRSERGRKERAEKGFLLAGRKSLYGYMWGDKEKTHYVPHPEHSPIVVRIFTELAAGTSLRGMCRKLTDEGIPTPNGNEQWDKSTLTRMIYNSTYWGEPVAYRYRHTKEQRVDAFSGLSRTVVKQTRRTDDFIPLPAGCAPALISADLAYQVHEQVARNNVVTPRGKTNPELYLLRGGFAICGHCKRTMSCRILHKKRYQYVCRTNNTKPHGCVNNAIERHTVDDAVWNEVVQVLKKPDVIANEVRRLQESHIDPTALKREALEAELADIEHQQQRTSNAIAKLTEEESIPLLALLRSLSKEARKVRVKLDKALQEQSDWEAAHRGLEHLTEFCERVVKKGELSFKEKQLILYALNVKVFIWKYGSARRFQIKMHPFTYSIDEDLPPDGNTAGSGGAVVIPSGDIRVRISPGSTQ